LRVYITDVDVCIIMTDIRYSTLTMHLDGMWYSFWHKNKY